MMPLDLYYDDDVYVVFGCAYLIHFSFFQLKGGIYELLTLILNIKPQSTSSPEFEILAPKCSHKMHKLRGFPIEK